jgi:hypothetical protein
MSESNQPSSHRLADAFANVREMYVGYPERLVEMEQTIAELRRELAVRDHPSDGISLIATERQRQVAVEGWTPEHDDEHNRAEMVYAAKTYLSAAVMNFIDPSWQSSTEPAGWPWAFSWWKPSPNPIRNLQKAGALIAAEIDRLLRQQRKGRA